MFYTINNLNLFVKEEGSGQPSLLFLHFWGGSAETWNGVIAMLTNRFRCISYDHRGWGRSDKPTTGYSIESLATDAMVLIETLGLENYVLVGHSMGGKVAQYIAARKPVGLKKLILVAPSPAGSTILPENMRGAMRNAYTSLDHIEATIDHVFKASDLRPEVRAQVIKDMQVQTDAARLGWTDIALPEDVSKGVNSIAIPTFIIAGENDIVDTPERLEHEVRLVIPGAKMVVVEGVGHLSMLQKPERIAELIGAFV
jgi:pimeloyl-ACP methyl ester carboxylesterase